MGFQCDEKQLQEVFGKLRKAMAQKNFATDEELEAVVREVLGK
jgi:isopropylmalate/homocitrate/citramalate synthase